MFLLNALGETRENDKIKESGDKVCVLLLFHFRCGVNHKEPHFVLTPPLFDFNLSYSKVTKCLKHTYQNSPSLISNL